MKIIIIYFLCMVCLFMSDVRADQPVDPPKTEPDWYENDDRNFMPLGVLTRQQILSGAKVFNYNYVEYAPGSDAVEAIYNVKQPVQIKVFFGDWCKDSKVVVPAFIKTMEFADNTNIEVTYINLTPDKTQPQQQLQGWNVNKLPTFIVLSNETEIGRIVATPKNRIETDLAEILSKL
jgi:thiol-disulfide isomerase/thioredoxin